MWVPFIGHLAAFPPANMVVKSRSTGGAATKGKNQKKVSGYNQEVIPFYMIEEASELGWKNIFNEDILQPKFCQTEPSFKRHFLNSPKNCIKSDRMPFWVWLRG